MSMGYLIDRIRSWFCKHEWELLKEVRLWDPYLSNEHPCGFVNHYVCKKCMRHKKIQM